MVGAGEFPSNAFPPGLGAPVVPGVTGAEPGMGGRDSKREAPKDEEGLNGLRPVK